MEKISVYYKLKNGQSAFVFPRKFNTTIIYYYVTNQPTLKYMIEKYMIENNIRSEYTSDFRIINKFYDNHVNEINSILYFICKNLTWYKIIQIIHEQETICMLNFKVYHCLSWYCNNKLNKEIDTVLDPGLISKTINSDYKRLLNIKDNKFEGMWLLLINPLNVPTYTDHPRSECIDEKETFKFFDTGSYLETWYKCEEVMMMNLI